MPKGRKTSAAGVAFVEVLKPYKGKPRGYVFLSPDDGLLAEAAANPTVLRVHLKRARKAEDRTDEGEVR